MGFGAFGKETRLHGGGFFNKIGSFVNNITSAVKPFVGTVAGIADSIKPGLGGAINTGFNMVDGISAGLKGGARQAPRLGGSRPFGVAKRNLASGRSNVQQSLDKVNSILNSRVPKRVERFDSEEYESNEETTDDEP
jgi:phage-related protein